jgi:hypothetical protein
VTDITVCGEGYHYFIHSHEGKGLTITAICDPGHGNLCLREFNIAFCNC